MKRLQLRIHCETRTITKLGKFRLKEKYIKGVQKKIEKSNSLQDAAVSSNPDDKFPQNSLFLLYWVANE